MAIKLRYRKLNQGYVTPYLDIHYSGKRWNEPLPLLKYKANPNNFSDRRDSNEKKELLNRVLRERELKLVMGEYDIKPVYNNKIDFFKYLEDYIKSYPNTGDARAYKSMQMHLKKFRTLSKEDRDKIKWAFSLVKEKRVVPSMRSMQ